MVTKLKSKKNEQSLFNEQIEATSLRAKLLEHKMQALRRGVIIPDSFLAEIEDFALRNAIEQNSQSSNEIVFSQKDPYFCERCVKAFALHHGKEHGLTKEAIVSLDNLFEIDAGHHGYYLDDDELISLNNFSLSFNDVKQS